jgi:eukaryotic-like serine/threonine-protein kinase
MSGFRVEGSAMARFWSRRPATTTAATRTTEEHVEVVPPRSPRPFWPWLLLLLALVLGGLALAWYLANRGDTVEAHEVPDVVGLKRDAAEERLKDEGFETEVKQVESSQSPGTVSAQRPDPGTKYGEGGIVVITAARSALQSEVPDVTGLQAPQALARLREAGFKPRAEPVSSRQPKGRVIRQIPEPGTELPKGSAAVVIVSSGTQQARVPSVVGISVSEATKRLTSAGFRTQVARVQSSEPEGRVVSQAPAAGATSERGRIVVSQGQTRTSTTVVTTTTTTSAARPTVPDTVGQDQATATSTLQGADFRVRVVEETVTDPAQDGLVIRQSPAGGGTARSGSTVVITVGHLR